MTPVTLDPWWKWRRRNLDLYEGTVKEQIDAIGGVGDVIQGLAILAKDPARQGILPITGASIADLMPWEALEARFIDKSLEYHPVRADGTVTAVPADRAGPLRVALLVGHEGPDKAFARDQELASLKNAFSASAQVSARVVGANTIATLDLASLDSAEVRRAFFAAADPHVVFYFGHGRSGSTPALRVGSGNGDWLPLAQLAAYASNAHPFPASWVFIACSIGEAPSREAGPAGPEAFRILARRGARAMLAMRARIRPRIARIVAASLIESLSAGTPLELAAATARKTARRARENENLILVDWAAPAVWSTVVGPMPPRGTAVPPELVAAKLTRAAAADPGLGLAAPDGFDADIAASWSQERRIHLDVSNEDDVSIAARLGRIAGAIGAASGRPSLFVRILGPAPFTTRLAEWASSVLPALDLSERETSVGRALRQLVNRNLEGLESLLGIPGMAVIFSSPPGASDATAWGVLEGAGADTTVVVCYVSVHQEPRPGWTADRIDVEDAMQKTLETLGRYPGTLALLAVLDSPANLGALSTITGESSADIAATGLTISMPSGVVLTASARNAIRANLSDDAIVQAHRRAFEARQSVPALIENDDIFAAVRDLVGANAHEITAFVNALALRSSNTWAEARWLELARVLEPAKHWWRGLDPRILLRIATALVMRQTLPQAKLWLDEVDTDDPELDSWRQSLLSEIAKAGGTAASQAQMWRHARGAVQRLEEAIAVGIPGDRSLYPRLRDRRANVARLELYFNHDAAAAKEMFARMVNELNGEPEAAVAASLVATLRNLAECLFEFEPFSSSPANRAEARSHLVRAAKVAQRHGCMALGAEALYSTAKLDENERDWAAAQDHLAATIQHAHLAGHMVCLRIAEMRAFWLGVRHGGAAFDHELFAARLRKLEYLESHVWARRYAAQSRIWGAQQLGRAGDHAGIQNLLSRNIASFEPIHLVSSSSDRRLVALSYAGLSSIEAASGGDVVHQASWTRFKALDWAPAWIQSQDVVDPLSIWNGAI